MRRQTFVVQLLAPALFAVVLASSACTSTMTYPEYPGAPRADPSLQPMPNLMGDSLKFAHQRIAPGTELVFNLPPNTPVQVWRGAAKRMESCRAMTPQDTKAWSVAQVRLSGGRAEVDVIYPGNDIYQMATVHFTGSTGQPFYPTMLQLWLVPVAAPSCNSPQAVIDDLKGKP